jgi:hypothetical protein
VNAVVNIWTAGSSAMGTYLATTGEHGAGTGTVSGNQVQISMGGESGSLSISSDASSITGGVAGSTCSHNISLKRIF